jgi:DNA-binding CsgD family transcriptional regulator
VQAAPKQFHSVMDERTRKRVEHGLQRIALGAKGYLDFTPPRLLRALDDAPFMQEHEIPVSLQAMPRRDSLTKRERDCLNAVSHGLSYNEAGVVLGISDQTVQTHLKHARFKLAAKNTNHLIALAFRRGILD